MAEGYADYELLELVADSPGFEAFRAQRQAGGEQVEVVRASPRAAALPGFRDAFFADLEAARALWLPTTQRVLEVAETTRQGQLAAEPYAVFEWLEGHTLHQLLQRARAHGLPLPPALAVAVLRPVLEALGHAHALSPPLLHREVCPRTMMLTADGRVVLTHFGLGRARRSVGAGLQGAYGSIEQARGQRVDASSDLFSAALVLFELVCGRLPAPGDSAEVMARLATGELDAPLTVNPALPEGLAAVLERALALNPTQRYRSAQTLLAALDALSLAPADQTVAAWAATVAALPEPPPAPPRAPAQAVPPAVVEAAVLEEPARSTAEPGLSPRRRLTSKRQLAAVALVVGATVAGQLGFRSWGRDSAVSLEDAPILTAISTEPQGAQVLLDGLMLDQRTPLTLKLEPHRRYAVELRGPHQLTWQGQMMDQKELAVRLATHDVYVDARYGDGPPKRTEPKRKEPKTSPAPAGAAPVAAGAPHGDRHPRFGASQTPASFDLVWEHQVRLPDVLCQPLREGRRKLFDSSGLLRSAEQMPIPELSATLAPAIATSPEGERELSPLWLMRGATQGVRSALVPGLERQDHPVCLFALSDRPGEFEKDALKTNGRPLQRDWLLKVGANRFILDSLQPEYTYRVTRGAPVSASPATQTPTAVMVLQGADPLEPQRVEVLDEEHTTFKGATAAWFIVPVVEQSDVVISLEVNVVPERPQKLYRPPGSTPQRLR